MGEMGWGRVGWGGVGWAASGVGWDRLDRVAVSKRFLLEWSAVEVGQSDLEIVKRGFDGTDVVPCFTKSLLETRSHVNCLRWYRVRRCDGTGWHGLGPI